KARQVGIGFAAALPLLLVALFLGLPRLLMGVANGKPTIFLIGTLVLGCALGIPLAIGRTLRRTRRGENLLSWLRARHTTLKGTGNAAGNAGLAVALFGTAVLATVGLADLKAWFPRQSATGSDG